MEIFRCQTCGNIVIRVNNGQVPLMCCGDVLPRLEAQNADMALEKHVPVVEINGNEVLVKVGSTPHPMTEAHLIEWILMETNKGYQLKYLNPEMEVAEATFVKEDDEEVLNVYEYCNLHGLWVNNLVK